MSKCVRDRDRRKGRKEGCVGVYGGVCTHKHTHPFFWRGCPYLFQRILKTIYDLQNI